MTEDKAQTNSKARTKRVFAIHEIKYTLISLFLFFKEIPDAQNSRQRRVWEGSIYTSLLYI